MNKSNISLFKIVLVLFVLISTSPAYTIGQPDLHFISEEKKDSEIIIQDGFIPERLLAVSPDDMYIANAGYNSNKITIWNKDGSLFNTIEIVGDNILSLAFHPEKNLIAFAYIEDQCSSNQTIDAAIINLTGEIIQKLECDFINVNSISFSPDGNTIALGGLGAEGGKIELWNINGNFINNIFMSDECIQCIFNPEDGNIASIELNGSAIKIWNLNGDLIFKIVDKDIFESNEFTGYIDSIDFSPDGKYIIASTWLTTYDETYNEFLDEISTNFSFMDDSSFFSKIKLWDIEGELIKVLSEESQPVDRVLFTPEGNIAAAVQNIVIERINEFSYYEYRNGTIKIWDNSFELINTIEASLGQIINMETCKDGSIYSLCLRGFEFWDSEGQSITIIPQDGSSKHKVIASPDNMYILGFSYEGKISIWDLNGVLISSIISNQMNLGVTRDVSFNNDSLEIILIYDFGYEIWSIEGELITTQYEEDWGWTEKFVSPLGKMVVPFENGTVKIYDSINMELTSIETRPLEQIYLIDFSTEENFFITLDLGNEIKLWNIGGELLNSITAFYYTNCIAVGPEAKNIIISKDNEVYILGNENIQIQADCLYVKDLAFHPNGNIFATCGTDRTIKLWDLEGNLLKTLSGHNSSVLSISFTPDGNKIISGSIDSSIRIWDVSEVVGTY